MDRPTHRRGNAGSRLGRFRVGGLYRVRDQEGVFELRRFNGDETVQVRAVAHNGLADIARTQLLPLIDPPQSDRPDLAAFSPDVLAVAERRLEVIQPLLAYQRVPKSVLDAQAAAAEVAPRTVRQWLNRYRANPVLSALLRTRRSDLGEHRFDDGVQAFFAQGLSLWRTKKTMSAQAAYREIENRITTFNEGRSTDQQLKLPNYTTFWRYCQKVSLQQVVAGKEGKRIAAARFGQQFGRIEGATHPLAIVQIDHTQLPIEVVDPIYRLPIGKPWITVLIDVFSRVVTGLYLSMEAPGNHGTGMAICTAILAKAALLAEFNIAFNWPVSGCPSMVLADNAGEFQGNMLELACREYSFALRFRKVKRPQYGAHIESYLGTLSKVLKELPGAVPTKSEPLGDYNWQDDAALTIDELQAWLLNQICGVYHNAPHSGLNDQPPLAKWAEGIAGTREAPGLGELDWPLDETKLRLDFLPVYERTIGPKGVELDRILYQDPVLAPWVGVENPDNPNHPKKFFFRRDDRAYNRLWFWEPKQRTYLPIPYRDLTHPTINRWEHSAIRTHLRRQGRSKVDEAAIFRAREEMLRIRDFAVSQKEEAKQRRARERNRQAAANATRTLKAIEQPSKRPAPSPVGQTNPFSMDTDDDIDVCATVERL